MNLKNITNDIKFKNLFLKHFIFENGLFIQNEDKYKEDYYYNDNSSHDKILKEGYAFFCTDEVLYLIYKNNILCYDSESSIRYIGDNIINTLYKIKEKDFLLGCSEINNFDLCIQEIENYFGKFDNTINYEKGRDFLNSIL